MLSLDQIVGLLHASPIPQNNISIAPRAISIDSRTLLPGDLYIAIKGETHDGHDFIKDAVAKGACAVVTTTPITSHVPMIVVENTLHALQTLASHTRSQSKARIIAITGSVGKTSTKEMLRHVLEAFGPTVASKASYNNQWGVPLSLLNLKPKTAFGVFEVGMNQIGEIEPLSKLIQPYIAIITAIGEAHIGHLHTLQAIAHEKSDLFKGLTPHNDESAPIAIINNDSPCQDIISAAAASVKLITCSTQTSANAYVHTMREEIRDNQLCIRVHAKIMEQTLSFTLQTYGQHSVSNTLLVLATCAALDLPLDKAVAQLETFVPLPGRGQTHHFKVGAHNITLIDDAYNANPTSMLAGLQTLSRICRHLPDDTQNPRRSIAVLGDMLELGNESARYHSSLAQHIVDFDLERILCCGPHMWHLYQELPAEKRGGYAETPQELYTTLMAQLSDGDVIYVKGSKGSRVSFVVDQLLRYKPTLF